MLEGHLYNFFLKHVRLCLYGYISVYTFSNIYIDCSFYISLHIFSGTQHKRNTDAQSTNICKYTYVLYIKELQII